VHTSLIINEIYTYVITDLTYFLLGSLTILLPNGMGTNIAILPPSKTTPQPNVGRLGKGREYSIA
jgi:hypothetical protein